MKFLVVLAAVIAVTCGHSPVLLWPAEEFAIPEGHSALDSMNLEDFGKLFNGKKIIVFHKKQFLLEEVSYPEKRLSYLQSADAIALQGVKSIHHFIGGLTSSDDLKFVRLADGPLDLQQEEIQNAMASNPGFAAILLGSGSHRSRRAAADPPSENACATPDSLPCMAYVGAVNKVGQEKSLKCSVTCENETGIAIKLDAETTLTVTLDSRGEGYNLAVDNGYKIDSETTWVPKEFSYSCAALQLVSKKKNAEKPTIILRKLQVFADKGANKEFPESYDCATWFTSTLWMGVVIATFYIFLLFGAVIFLLDVKTNDRFDDPKGKTITVNVAE